MRELNCPLHRTSAQLVTMRVLPSGRQPFVPSAQPSAACRVSRAVQVHVQAGSDSAGRTSDRRWPSSGPGNRSKGPQDRSSEWSPQKSSGNGRNWDKDRNGGDESGRGNGSNNGEVGWRSERGEQQGLGTRRHGEGQEGGGGWQAWGDGGRAGPGGGSANTRDGGVGGGRQERFREHPRDTGRWQDRDARRWQDRPRGRPRSEEEEQRRDDEDDGEREEEEEEGDNEGYREERGRWGHGPQGPQGSPDIRKSELIGEALYGIFPVLNALKTGRRRKIYTLYVLSTMDLSKRKDAAAVRAVLNAAEQAEVELIKVSRHELNLLTEDRPHQGIVLDCEPLSFVNLDAMAPASQLMQGTTTPPVWLALDEVMDPQNLGAILRSAWCLGASGVLTSSKNCCPLSPAVSKASAGAMELAAVHATKSMQRTLQDAVSKGWAVLGAAGEAGSKDISTYKVEQPTILVVGNEGYGLRTNIRRLCTGLVKVNMSQGMTGMGAAEKLASGADASGVGTAGSKPPRAQGVDSLNVSVATGILLHNALASARLRQSI